MVAQDNSIAFRFSTVLERRAGPGGEPCLCNREVKGQAGKLNSYLKVFRCINLLFGVLPIKFLLSFRWVDTVVWH